MKAPACFLPLFSLVALPLSAATEAEQSAISPKPAVPEIAVPSVGFTELMSVSVGLMVVLGLLLGGAWLLRKMPAHRFGHSDSPIELVAQRSLGVKDRLIWVRVDGQNVLLGASTGQMRALHQWSASADDNTQAEGFAAQLGEQMRATQDGDRS